MWPLFIINLLGTIYGYIWYENQLIWTIENFSNWLLPFVPDSPTASLFFTIAILILLYPPKRINKFTKWFRICMESLAIVCSIKYGVWATAIILAGAAQGEPLNWQSYMLMTSHLAMAFEVLLYARFMTVRGVHLLIGTAWLLLNDVMDYSYGIYPYLPRVLHDQVNEVMWFTFGLSIVSFIAGYIAVKKNKRS